MAFNPVTLYRDNFENYPEFVRRANQNRVGLIATVIGTQATPAIASGTISSGTISTVTISGTGGRYPGGLVPIVVAHSTTSGTFSTNPILGAVMKISSIDQIVTSGTISASYAPQDTISIAGGTLSGTGIGILTVSTTKVVALSVNAAGGTISSYAINDTITLSGGSGTAGVVTVTALTLAGTTISAAGINYQAGDTVFLAGGTFFTNASSAPNTNQAELTISTTKLVQLSLPVGGATGQNYKVNDTITLGGGTNSTAAIVTVTAVNTAGAVTAFSITTSGSYTVNATTWNQSSTTGVGTGASFATGIYGVNTVTITQGGTYTAVPSLSTPLTQAYASGSGTGLTITASWGVATVNITNNGNYSSNVSTFTQSSTSGNGTGVTFNGAIYGVNTLTVTTAGTYLATPGAGGAPVTQLATSGSGVGFSCLLSWAVVAVNITGGGTGSVTAFTLGFLTGPATLTNQGLTIGGTGPDTTEDTLLQYALQPKTLRDVGDTMTIYAWGTTGTTGNNKTLKAYVGGLSGTSFSSGTQTGNNVAWFLDLELTVIGQNLVTANVEMTFGTTIALSTVETFQVELGGSCPIVITGTNGTAQANDLSAQCMQIQMAA